MTQRRQAGGSTLLIPLSAEEIAQIRKRCVEGTEVLGARDRRMLLADNDRLRDRIEAIFQKPYKGHRERIGCDCPACLIKDDLLRLLG